MDFSRDYISKMFKLQTGMSLLEYMNSVRIEKACELLANGSCNISEVAEKIGYSNMTTFIRVFTKYKGTTPGRYRI